MLPDKWLPYLFPAALRDDLGWVSSFARNRRTYLLGFPLAAYGVRRHTPEAVREQASPRFREDPRRIIPYAGWRDVFDPDTGEAPHPEGGQYREPPPQARFADCKKWGAFGKDQADHAWLKRTMRLYDALKAIALLHEAEPGGTAAIRPAPNGFPAAPGEIALHLAIYTLNGFDADFYDEHFAGNRDRLLRLYDAASLRQHIGGAPTQTFYKMSRGFSATERTCLAIRRFCQDEKLPIGAIQPDLSVRGTNRTARAKVKRVTRVGPLQHYSQDCCVEAFTRI